ncbi:MAG: thiamine pyrophosphate-dependent enzyme, partial [Eubacteriales bacterium]
THYVELNENKRLIMSGGLGTMGFGFPASLGAQLGCPDRRVVSISGDGGFQMNLQEFATAVSEELPVIACVFNNYKLGMVRQMQKLSFGKRYSATCLNASKSCRKDCKEGIYNCPPYSPDFVKLAESYGAKAIRVEKNEDIAKAFEMAKQETKVPTLIEFMIDCEELVLPMVRGGSSLEDMILDC